LKNLKEEEEIKMKENTVKLIMESLKEAGINTIIVLPD